MPVLTLALPGDGLAPPVSMAPPSPAAGSMPLPIVQPPDPLPWRKLGMSLAVATAAATLATATGAALAAAITLTDLPGRSFWAVTLLFPFLAPSTAWTLGQTYCYGAGGLLEQGLGDVARPWLAWIDRGGYVGTLLVLAEIHAPLALLLAARGMAGLQQAGFDSARLQLGSFSLIRWMAGALRPELAASFLLSFALSLGNFAVPNVLQCRLFPIEIYLRLTNYFDADGAIAWTGMLLLTTLGATGLIAFVERRRRYANATIAPRPELIELGRRKWLVGGALAVYAGVTAGLPLAAMVHQCRSPADFLAAVRGAAPETENTLIVAFFAAIAAAAAGAIVSTWLSSGGRVLREMAAILPLGIPALVLGLSYSQFYNRTWPVDLAALGDGKTLIVLGLAARAWPFATRVLADGRRRIALEIDEAAQLACLNPIAWWRWIRGPLLANHFFAGTVLAFVLAMGEVEISQMLCAPGDGTLALRLFTFLHFGPVHEAASIGLLQLLLAALPVLSYWLITDHPLPII